MTTRTLLVTAFLLTACGPEPTTPEASVQPATLVDFEDGLPAPDVTLVNHTTDGGVWSAADVSAWGEGGQSAWLSASSEDGEAGEARVALEAIDLVGPARVSADIAFPARPFNSPQRLEILLIGESGEAQVDFELDGLSEVFLSGGTEDFEPAPEEWFTITAELDPDVLGDWVQISLRIVEDFPGLRPDVYVDNLAIEPR